MTSISKVVQDRIKADNDRFMAMNNPDKRVAIALDVLDQMKLSLITPTQGTYFEAKLAAPAGTTDDLRDVLAGSLQCQVCARGALFVGMVNRFDEFSVGQIRFGRDEVDGGGDLPVNRSKLEATNFDFDRYMTDLFSAGQLALIEWAFERWEFEAIDPDLAQYDRDWVLDGYNPATRMRLVMENIVVNGGFFHPSLVPCFRGAYPYIPGFEQAEAAARKLQGVGYPSLTQPVPVTGGQDE